MTRRERHVPGCTCCAAGHDTSVVDAQVAEAIERHGWAVVGVPLPRGRGHVAYTVGLGGLNLPELYAEGPLSGLLASRMNEMARVQRAAGVPWKSGDVIELEHAAYRVVPITKERLPMVARFYGRDMPAWRMDYAV